MRSCCIALSVILALTCFASISVKGELVCQRLVASACNSSCYCSGEEPIVSSSNTTGDEAVDEENVALAFGLVTAAGLSTSLGAALVFCNCAVKQDNFHLLGAALGFSAGVMLYVSFVEIFGKSNDSFVEYYLAEVYGLDPEACNSGKEDVVAEAESTAYIMATLCFFGGVLVTLLLDKLVVCISKRGGSHGHSHDHRHVEDSGSSTGDGSTPIEEGVERVLPNPDALTDTAFAEVTAVKAKKSSVEDGEGKKKTDPLDVDREETENKKRLNHMGIMTALAIALHNFPEGLVTFVSTLDDPAVGVALAVAIAIHNIPEGMCVAVPLFYSSGSRWKGFGYAFVSGLSELLGALLGYLFLQTVLGPVAYGILFGVVAGMMVTIVVKELLPTAHRYDMNDKYVTTSFFAGGSIMALSLVMFVI